MLTHRVKTAYFSNFPYVFWDNFFTEQELDLMETYFAAQPLQPALVGDGEDNTFGRLNQDIRKSDLSFIDYDSENEWIFHRLFALTDLINRQFYAFDLIGFDFLQYTLYDKEGSYYGYHMDMQENSSGGAVPRKLSFSLVLSDPAEHTGGDLEFYIDGITQTRCEQRRGRVLAFPSWIMHQVTPVTQGTRRSLVWWACGPKFR